MNYAIDALMRTVEDAERDRDTHAEEVAELTAERDRLQRAYEERGETLVVAVRQRDEMLRILNATEATEREEVLVDQIRAEHAAALERARREGAEAMLKRCRAAAREAFDSHPLTLDRYHEPGCICHAIARGSCSECDRGDAILAALAALPLDAPGGES